MKHSLKLPYGDEMIIRSLYFISVSEAVLQMTVYSSMIAFNDTEHQIVSVLVPVSGGAWASDKVFE